MKTVEGKVKEDKKKLKGDLRKKDKDFVVTRYRNLPFIVVQSRSTGIFYKADLNGVCEVPLIALPKYAEKAKTILADHKHIK